MYKAGQIVRLYFLLTVYAFMICQNTKIHFCADVKLYLFYTIADS